MALIECRFFSADPQEIHDLSATRPERVREPRAIPIRELKDRDGRPAPGRRGAGQESYHR